MTNTIELETAVVELDLGIEAIEDIVARSPFCATARSPFCATARSPFCATASAPAVKVLMTI